MVSERELQPHFYPRSPCGERLEGHSQCCNSHNISIHALLAESDIPSHWIMSRTGGHFYPRSPCGERPYMAENESEPQDISIHALLAESDYYQDKASLPPDQFLSTLSLRRATLGAWKSCNVCRISIHALLAESDMLGGFWVLLTLIFLSTLSLRRATLNGTPPLTSRANFYPRSPCGERRHVIDARTKRTNISIHALLAESDASRIAAE